VSIAYKIGKYVPRLFKPIAKRLYVSTYLRFMQPSGTFHGIPLPPKTLASEVGGGNFMKIGKGSVDLLVSLGGLQSFHHVLDVGCGIGIVAIPLSAFLDKNGSYEGFDIDELMVKWCQTYITSRYPNFNFRVAGLRAGDSPIEGNPSIWTFPYKSESFDLVFLFSVFTHMFPNETENYLSEINRVLKSGGKVLATF